jgi:hypothetical protein
MELTRRIGSDMYAVAALDATAEMCRSPQRAFRDEKCELFIRDQESRGH